MKYYFLAFKKILDFKGNSNLVEFWSFFLINIFVSTIILITSKKFFSSEIPSNVYRIFSLIPMYSLGFRRLRNAGLSPWLFLIPIINLILAIFPEKEFKKN